MRWSSGGERFPSWRRPPTAHGAGPMELREKDVKSPVEGRGSHSKPLFTETSSLSSLSARILQTTHAFENWLCLPPQPNRTINEIHCHHSLNSPWLGKTKLPTTRDNISPPLQISHGMQLFKDELTNEEVWRHADRIADKVNPSRGIEERLVVLLIKLALYYEKANVCRSSYPKDCAQKCDGKFNTRILN